MNDYYRKLDIHKRLMVLALIKEKHENDFVCPICMGPEYVCERVAYLDSFLADLLSIPESAVPTFMKDHKLYFGKFKIETSPKTEINYQAIDKFENYPLARMIAHCKDKYFLNVFWEKN